ncbi:uncharacterized protein LOC132737422 [Ruditapes philippinarum]|uniref:uncharacterized protein LOC132737422 n=1 Tax=Ruditapes philippinarum TaxID=129788 RepID=UPI00295AE196|nr:uncharacterized protein LOC132737422 [Ruditapes philippinarum]
MQFQFDITYTQLNESEELATGSLETEVVSFSQFILTLFVKCTQCDSLITLAGSDSTDLSISHSDKIVVGYDGQQYTTGESIVGSMMWKQITVKYSGTEIITYLDSTEVLREQVSPQRRKRSTETPVNITVTIGGEGFIGSFSQLNVWSGVTSFTPVVTDTCFNTGQGDLISWKQFSDTEGSFIITKSKCDVDNNCDDTPCHNGGTCRDSVGSFSCACARGFLPEVSVRSISMTVLTTRVITTLHASMDLINIVVFVRLALRVTYVKPLLRFKFIFTLHIVRVWYADLFGQVGAD